MITVTNIDVIVFEINYRIPSAPEKPRTMDDKAQIICGISKKIEINDMRYSLEKCLRLALKTIVTAWKTRNYSMKCLQDDYIISANYPRVELLTIIALA